MCITTKMIKKVMNFEAWFFNFLMTTKYAIMAYAKSTILIIWEIIENYFINAITIKLTHSNNTKIQAYLK